jgi:hypothetical protein
LGLQKKVLSAPFFVFDKITSDLDFFESFVREHCQNPSHSPSSTGGRST